MLSDKSELLGRAELGAQNSFRASYKGSLTKVVVAAGMAVI